MNIDALAAALPVRFDFILMDACLMGSVEVVYELRNKADFIIVRIRNITTHRETMLLLSICDGIGSLDKK